MRQTIAAALAELTRRDPQAVAVIDRHRSLTRAEMQTATRRVAALLRERGVEADDIVTIVLPNGADFVVVCCAIWLIGATPHPLSARLPIHERREVVRIAGARAVIGAVPGGFGDVAVVTAAEITESMAQAAGDRREWPDLAARSWKASTSSGSTGRPKVVVAAGSAHIDPDRPVASFLPLGGVQLVVAPLSHSAPFTYAMRGLMTGQTLAIEPRFDAAATLEAITEHRVTWLMLAPTMMHRIRRLPDGVLDSAELGSLQIVLHIGAPIAADLKRWWLDWLGAERVVEVYSGSESSGLTVIRGDEWLRHPGSVGRAAPGTELRVVDGAGEPVAPGVLGLVQLRKTTGISYRYLGAESRADADGWDTLGDDGHLDSDGYLWVVDRADDRLQQDGVTFYPSEVEQAIERHPLVRSAIVAGRPADEGGCAVHAVVDVDDAQLTVDELRGWLRAELAPEKRPRTISIVHAPVRDDAGKARRSSHH